MLNWRRLSTRAWSSWSGGPRRPSWLGQECVEKSYIAGINHLEGSDFPIHVLSVAPGRFGQTFLRINFFPTSIRNSWHFQNMSLPIPTGSSNIDPNDASLVEYTSVAATPPSHGSTFLPPLGVLPPHHPGVPIPTTSPVPIPGCSTGTDSWYKLFIFTYYLFVKSLLELHSQLDSWELLFANISRLVQKKCYCLVLGPETLSGPKNIKK